MSKLTFTNTDKFAKEVLGYKSYKKYIIPAATDEGPGTLEVDVTDLVVVPEKEIIDYFTQIFSKEGISIQTDYVSEEDGGAVENTDTTENVTPTEDNVSETTNGDEDVDIDNTDKV